MKAWIFSDIHLTRMPGMISSPPFPVPEADICIVAGDTSSDLSTALDYLETDIAPCMPIVATLGNHEYYGLTIERALDRARRRCRGTDIHLLENDAIEIGDVRFIGATLWTDLAVETGEDIELPEDLRQQVAKSEIKNSIADYTEIRSNTTSDGLISPDELIERHMTSRAYIEQELAQPFAGKTVVVTHHAPLPRSLDRRFKGLVSNAAYASNLSSVIATGKPDYWVHGHVHKPFDYFEGSTRIICNPRGFSNERNAYDFNASFILTI